MDRIETKASYSTLIVILCCLHITACSNKGPVDTSTNDMLQRNEGQWKQLSESLGGRNVSIVVNEDGYIFVGNQVTGVFLSSDNGISWKSMNSGLTNKQVNALAINSVGDIFAATDGGGVFRSSDNLPEKSDHVVINSLEQSTNAGWTKCPICFRNAPPTVNNLKIEQQLGIETSALLRYYFPVSPDMEKHNRVTRMGLKILENWSFPLKGYVGAQH